MEDQRRCSAHRPVFKRYSALEVLEEVLNECDSGDKDFGGPHDSDSDEGEMDNNQHHPLLSDVVGDNDYDTNSEPGNSETESDSQHDSDAAKVPDAIPSTSSHLLLSWEVVLTRQLKLNVYYNKVTITITNTIKLL